jgi:phospholipid/cholesterol/gamma-HCH transport system ATP-binding protein
MIEIEQLYKRMGSEWVLRGVDLRVETGQCLGLVGASGCGKSVLLRHVIGLLVPDHGEIRIHGESIAHARYRDLPALRRRMGYVFQESALLDSLTVEENLRLALDDEACERDPEYAPRRIVDALELVNLEPDVLSKLPGSLSGGMRKRVGVARAVIREPLVVLYDEPATGLDPHNAAVINDIITRARARLGATAMVVTHNVWSLPQIADSVALLDEGRIVFRATPAEFLDSQDPYVRSFLGPLAEAGKEASTWPATAADATPSL